LVTTSTSGISMIPDFRNCSTSPLPGCTTTTTVSATSAISVSAWPTPTVSITTTSNAAASACAAARVAEASPPSRSPAAVERIKHPAVGGSNSIRARSPSSEPPERRELGRRRASPPCAPARARREQAESSVDLPRPGGPGDPITCPGASPPSAAGETSPAARRLLCARRPRRSRAGSARRRRAQVALAQARAEGGSVSLTRRSRGSRWRSSSGGRRRPPARRCRA
jgi:hypothetical protein